MIEELISTLKGKGFYLYPKSIRKTEGGATIFVAKRGCEKFICVIEGSNPIGLSPEAAPAVENIGFYKLSWENYLKLREVLPIAPSPCNKKASFGTGDRLGLVTAAHLDVLSRYPVLPVVAQQSPRELMKEHRTFKSVLLDAVMGLLESGYTGAFGADADHIKDEEHLREGAAAGYSMYTLDVSDWLNNVGDKPESQKREMAKGLSQESQSVIAENQGRKIQLPGGGEYTVSELELLTSALIYEKSMQKVCEMDGVIREYLQNFDLEVSIDEGSRETTPEDHLFVAEYLHKRGIDFKSLAPKFPGEFQKGVDFVGDLDAFTKSLKIQVALSREIGGYRLSLHSGSDKFSVYPIFGDVTGGNFHIKTSGTSWLQAVKLVAAANAELLQRLYALCLQNLDESKKAYHVSITSENFPPALPDGDLLAFCDRLDVRQLFHISYGVLLDEEKDQIFNTLCSHEEEHYALVSEHIEKHLNLIYRS